MARTWFAGLPTAQTVPPSKDPNGAVSIEGDPVQPNGSASFKNKTAVNDCATAHQMTPTNATHSDSESDRPETWVTPFSSPQKKLDIQQSHEVIIPSTELARLTQQHSKPTNLQIPATSKEPTTSQPVEMSDECAPSSSPPRRAPIAQMVPLPPDAAVTTTPAATATSETSTASLFGSYWNALRISNPRALFPTTALPSLQSRPIPISSRTASPKRTMPMKFLSRVPRITLTPAPTTAPTAFKDAVIAAHIQNTKLLSPVKQPTNGVEKRQHIRTSSSSTKRVLTPERVREKKRGRGRPRTRSEEQTPPQNRQHRPPVQWYTPCPRTGPSDLSSSSRFTPSVFPLQQQHAVTLNVNNDLEPKFCSEEPRLWHGRGDYVASLLRFDSEPEKTHSEPVQACANRAAHQDPHKPYVHGVCITCHYAARRHLKATRPELFGPTWWPLCRACGDYELQHANPDRKGCHCGRRWLCFSCQTLELERRTMKDSVEAGFRRRSFVGEEMDGDDKTVLMGWRCECGREIEPNATLVRCIGCRGMRFGSVSPREEIARGKALIKAALAWT